MYAGKERKRERKRDREKDREKERKRERERERLGSLSIFKRCVSEVV